MLWYIVRDGAFVAGTGIHLGVAISLRQGGLIAPAIRDVDAMGVDELMRRLADLVARARALTLRSSEMTDATITVTNLATRARDRPRGDLSAAGRAGGLRQGHIALGGRRKVVVVG
jgi:pyruvate dehydrogenase E2 component (dihydrolipoamide acetyltransferase)